MLSRLPGLSVVVPAFNEEATLESVVRDVLSVAPGLAAESEVIIIDDGSTDKTPAIADGLAGSDPRVRVVHHERNLGFGGTQKTGFREAKLPFITLIPADGQFPAGDLQRFLPFAEEADVVLGYRIGRRDSLGRRIQTAVFKMVFRHLLGLRFKDINWVKLYRRDAVRFIDIQSRRIGVDAEVVAKIMRRGGKVKEVEVSYVPRRAGVASGSQPAVLVKTLLELSRLWWDLKTGKIQ